MQSGEVLPIGETVSRKVNVRFVTASHQDLRQRAADGRFREDLFFRLNQASLSLRPLRERREEIAWLMQLDVDSGPGALPLHVTAVELALLRSWPGNLRELRSAVKEAHAAALLDNDRAVRARHFNEHAGKQLVASVPGRAVASSPSNGPPVPDVVTHSQAEVVAALEANAGNVAAAARQLGLHRTQLYRVMTRHGLIKKDDVEPAE